MEYRRLDVKKYVFANRVVETWNSLSGSCINSTSVNIFKVHLSRLQTGNTLFKVYVN